MKLAVFENKLMDPVESISAAFENVKVTLLWERGVKKGGILGILCDLLHILWLILTVFLRSKQLLSCLTLILTD